MNSGKLYEGEKYFRGFAAVFQVLGTLVEVAKRSPTERDISDDLETGLLKTEEFSRPPTEAAPSKASHYSNTNLNLWWSDFEQNFGIHLLAV